MLSLGVVLALAFIAVIILIVFFQFIPFGLWLTALFSGVRVSFFTLFIPPGREGEYFSLYQMLERMADNPMVMLNRVVAQAMVHGPATGLQELAALDTKNRLAGHHRLLAVRAHFLEMAGDIDAAADHYRQAAGKTASTSSPIVLTTRP